MCGVVGMVSRTAVNQQLYDALTVLQHRGQDAAGIVTCDGGHLFLRKGNGLVSDVFPAAAHAAAGRQHGYRSRPLSDRRQFELRRSSADVREFAVRDHARAQRQSDELGTTERGRLPGRPAAREYRIGLGSAAERVSRTSCSASAGIVPKPDHIFEAVAGVHQRCRGAFAVVAMVIGGGIVGFRDQVRYSSAGVRQTRDGIRYRLHDRVGERGARHSRFSTRQRRRAGRGGLHQRAG